MADRVEEAQASTGAESQANPNLGSFKKTEKRTPKKLNPRKLPQQQPTPEPTPEPGQHEEVDLEEQPDQSGEIEVEEPESDQGNPLPEKLPIESKRKESRGRGRRNMPDSDTESVARSEVSATGGGRRNRQRQRTKQKTRNQSGLGSIGEGLPGGELVSGATDVVQNTAGGAVNQVGETVGNTLGGLQQREEDDKGEQLRLRLELNLDIEVQLKAKIHGDLTLGLLYVFPFQPILFPGKLPNTDRDTVTKRSCREVEDWKVRPRRSLKVLIASPQFRKFWHHLKKT
jgi:hypothetical protein